MIYYLKFIIFIFQSIYREKTIKYYCSIYTSLIVDLIFECLKLIAFCNAEMIYNHDNIDNALRGRIINNKLLN